jgi:hypothetical protein
MEDTCVAEVPEHLQRWPTSAARQALAARLGLPYDRQMQDWEWEVAHSSLFPAFLAAYRGGDLDDDERFSLMECLVQSVADMTPPPGGPPKEWASVAELFRAAPQLHTSTIAYRSRMTGEEGWEWAGVSEAMRQVWADVRGQLVEPLNGLESQ